MNDLNKEKAGSSLVKQLLGAATKHRRDHTYVTFPPLRNVDGDEVTYTLAALKIERVKDTASWARIQAESTQYAQRVKMKRVTLAYTGPNGEARNIQQFRNELETVAKMAMLHAFCKESVVLAHDPLSPEKPLMEDGDAKVLETHPVDMTDIMEIAIQEPVLFDNLFERAYAFQTNSMENDLGELLDDTKAD